MPGLELLKTHTGLMIWEDISLCDMSRSWLSVNGGSWRRDWQIWSGSSLCPLQRVKLQTAERLIACPTRTEHGLEDTVLGTREGGDQIRDIVLTLRNLVYLWTLILWSVHTINTEQKGLVRLLSPWWQDLAPVSPRTQAFEYWQCWRKTGGSLKKTLGKESKLGFYWGLTECPRLEQNVSWWLLLSIFNNICIRVKSCKRWGTSFKFCVHWHDFSFFWGLVEIGVEEADY